MTWGWPWGHKRRGSGDVLNNPEALDRLLKALYRQWNTPDLIAYLADDRSRLFLLKALVSPVSKSDYELAGRAREVLSRRGMDAQGLRKRLEPAAYALGLVSASDAPLDHYDILGVSHSATSEDIRAAYRKKAFELHPDTARAAEADPSAFATLQAAYDTLMDPRKRAAYEGCRNCLGMWHEGEWGNSFTSEETKKPGSARRVGFRLAGIVIILVMAAWVMSILFEDRALWEPVQETPSQVSKLNDESGAGGPAVVSVSESPSDVSEEDMTSEGPSAPDQAASQDKEAPVSAESSIPAVRPAKGLDLAKTALISAGEKVDKTARSAPEPPDKKTPVSKKSRPDKVAEARAPTQQVKKEVKRPDATVKANQKGPVGKPNKAKPVRTAAAKKGEPMDRPVLKMNPPDPQEVRRPDTKPLSTKPIPQTIVANSAAAENAFKEHMKHVRLTEQTKLVEPPKNVTTKPTEPKPHPVSRAQVLEFLKQYTRAYEEGQDETFFSFFTKDATENGRPLEALKPKYRELWDRMKTMDYLIDVVSLDEIPEQSEVTVEGRFKLWWDAMDQSWGQSHGDIFLTLDSNGSGLRVKQLRYRFD